MGSALPGIGSTRVAGLRRVLLSEQLKALLPRGVTVDGAKSRDPGNTGDADVLRCGVLMGKITSTGKYAPAVLGVTAAAYVASAAGATITVSPAVAAEIVRRIGAAGTFNLTGPATAGGAVRTLTITYAAVNLTTGAITVTDISEDVTPTAKIVQTTQGGTGVNEVQTLTMSAKGGTFRVGFGGEWTVELPWNVTTAALQAALVGLSTIGASGAVVAGTAGAAYTVTFGGDLAETNVALLDLDLSNLASYAGDFVVGSLVQPTDGSQTPLGIMGREEGLKVTDEDGANRDVQLESLLIGGMVAAGRIVNYPADAAIKAWVKAALRGVGAGYVFDDDFLP